MRWAIWWFAVFAAYVITVLTRNGSEIVAGAIIAALSTVIVAAGIGGAKPGVRGSWRWLHRLAHVPAQMIRDAFVVSGRILRSFAGGTNLDGYFVRLPYDPGDREDEWTIGREGVAVFGISAAPNSVVVEVDLRGEMVIHKLVVGEQPHESPEWPL
jgi:hypothetical protein